MEDIYCGHQEWSKAQFHDKEEAEGVFIYPKEDFCKQLKQHNSTGWHESICPVGPDRKQPPSPDERCPFPSTRVITVIARQRGRDDEKDKQSCSGQGEAGLTSRDHPWAYCYNHWWHESRSEDEEQWPAILSTCGRSTDSHPTWRSHRINVVFDVHQEDSIKNADMSNRIVVL